MPSAARTFSTARQVEAAKPDPAGRIEIPDATTKGLYLVIQPSGAKSWAVRYRVGGKPAKLTLGAFPLVKLEEARELARDARRAASEGRDPAAARRTDAAAEAERARNSVGALAELFIAKHCRPRNRSAGDQERQMRRYVLPILGADKDVSEIRKRDVIELLDRVAEGNIPLPEGDPSARRVAGGPIMANRVLALVRKWANWLVARDVLAVPFTAGVEAPSPETKRDRVLTDAELVEVWRAAEAVGGWSGALVRLLILTAARRDEIATARLSWIDRGARSLTVPASEYKTGIGHMIPLTGTALEIIDAAPIVDGRDWLFPSQRALSAAEVGDPERDRPVSGYSKAKEILDRAINAAREKAGAEPMADWTLHDLRRTVRTGLSRLGFPPHVGEAVLGHTIKGVQAHYDLWTYAPEKRAALEAWERHVLGLLAPQAAPVVNLNAARARKRRGA